MSAGSSIPYALRHNKFVDRRIFVDLLTRIDRWQPIEGYLYVSMGGKSLEDHKLVHSHLGIRKLVSIDESEQVIQRQRFNRPVDDVRCLEITTADLAARFRTEIAALGFDAETPVIVWFDYTRPAQLADQIAEFVQILNTMSAGDVVRVTVNAHPPALFDGRGQKEPEALAAARLAELTKRLGSRMPDGIDAMSMTAAGVAQAIAEAFRAAALEALPAEDPHTFLPLSAVRYADGQQMLALTGVVLLRTQVDEFNQRVSIGDWAFASDGWTDIVDLNTPELTLRERLFLDQVPMTDTIQQVRAKLGFDFDGKERTTHEVVDQYRRNGRFYPHFHYVPT